MSNEKMLFSQVKRQEKQLSTVVNLLTELIEGVEAGAPAEQMKPLADKATRYLLFETNLGINLIKPKCQLCKEEMDNTERCNICGEEQF